MRLILARGHTVCWTLSLGLAACGGGGGGGGGGPPPPSYTIGGAVSGLATGESVALADNNGDTLTVSGNNSFVFPTKIDQNGSYAVTVTTQPRGQNCTVSVGGLGICGQQRRQHDFSVQRQRFRRFGRHLGCGGCHGH